MVEILGIFRWRMNEIQETRCFYILKTHLKKQLKVVNAGTTLEKLGQRTLSNYKN
jgi:hypothetical protein